VQFGGQTPLKLSRALEAAGAPIIGTSPDSIDIAEDRERFQILVRNLGSSSRRTPRRAPRPAVRLAREVGFPLVVRPSYVLGGRAMEVVFNEDDLRAYMTHAMRVSNDSPVLLDRFLDVLTIDTASTRCRWATSRKRSSSTGLSFETRMACVM